MVPLIPQYHLLQQPTTGEAPQVQNEESAEGVAAVVEQCDAMETTEELPPSPTQQEPTLTQEEEQEEEGGASGEAMLEVDDDREAADHTAVATTVTVVSSPSPSSTSSSTTELASAQSVSSDSTFMSVEEVIFEMCIMIFRNNERCDHCLTFTHQAGSKGDFC